MVFSVIDERNSDSPLRDKVSANEGKICERKLLQISLALYIVYIKYIYIVLRKRFLYADHYFQHFKGTHL